MNSNIRQRAHIFLKSHIFVLNKFLNLNWHHLARGKICQVILFDRKLWFQNPNSFLPCQNFSKTALITTCEEAIVEGTLTSDAGLPALQNIGVLRDSMESLLS